ncbi:MAG: branched-chain amino acid transporter permease [Clostridia bacterium]|nr:branched-chain amino acid transporter permease [Clostridia bacterium]
MELTALQTLAIFGAVMIGTMITRFTPFLLFPENKPLPKVIHYLGRVLPAAMIALLVVYCFKNVSLIDSPHGLPELIACAFVALLQMWRRNTLLSIALGTALYMALIQVVFV